MSNGSYKKQTALLKTVEDGIDTTVFIVRDEAYLGKIDSNKTSVSLVSDGERVAENEIIAAQFSSEEEAENYKKKLYYQNELDRYNSLLNQKKINISDILSYDLQMNDLFQKYVDSIRTNTFTDARESISDYCSKLTSRQSAMGGEIVLDEIINDLNSKLNKLRNIEPDFIISKSTGYFVNGVDGYENIIKYEDVLNVTTQKIEEAIKSEKNPDESYAGKIINHFNWYMVCSVTSKDVQNIKVGDTVDVRFQNAASMDEKVQVAAINTEGKDKVALVLKCNNVTSKVFPLRKEKVKIITDTFEGYSISKKAVRSLDGYNGVYVLRGKIINFRYVDIIYSDNENVIVRTYEDENRIIAEKKEQEKSSADDGTDRDIARRTEESDDIIVSENSHQSLIDIGKYIKLYDEVIVKGSDLSDGKLVQ